MDDETAAALGRLTGGLYVLATRYRGMLVSWVQQASFEPPLLTLALGRDREALAELEPGEPCALSILSQGQSRLMKPFFASDDPFSEVETRTTPGGLRVLAEAVAWLEARVVNQYPAGDHLLVVAEATAGAVQGDGEPAAHWRKSGRNY